MSNSNPDNRKPKPIRNPKLPKLQKNKPGYDNEMDLWNLEDDAASSPSVTPIEESRINETSTTSEKTDKPKEAVAAEVDSQPFAEIEVPAELQSTAEDETDHAPSITVNTIDQKRSISHEYRYETPERLAVAPTEEEIWGDFVDDVKLEQPEDQDAPAAPAAEEEVAVVLTKIDVEPAKPSVAKIITPERKKPALISTSASPSDAKSEAKPEPTLTKKESVSEKSPLAESDHLDAEESAASDPAPVVTPGPLIQITKFSRTEVIASLAFLLILIFGSFFVLRSYRSNLTVEQNLYAKPDYPVKGQITEVKSSLTYWRAPIKDGPNPDPIKLDVKLLPVIEITLGSASSQGALRVMFHNEKGEIVGDTVTQNFSQGKFTLSSSESRAFSSTAGFIDFGEQEAYRTGQGKPWTIKVYEGPSDNASSDQFRLLFTTPIATERR